MRETPLRRFSPHDTHGTPGGTSIGNQVEVLSDGTAAYQAALADIRRAQRLVWLETYILEPDEVGVEFIETLADAARRGCDVRLIFDRFGSPKISAEHAKPIEQAGGRVAMYNPFITRRIGKKISNLLHRDHRKILVADDVGYTGGRNISTDYGGTGEDRFFDLTVRLRGPAVGDLASVFADAFRDASGESLALPSPPESFDEGMLVDVLELNRHKSHHDLDIALRKALQRARTRVLLVTPYFVPPPWFMKELNAAAKRGVDVQLLTAGRSDVPFVKVAGRYLYGRLLRRGMRVFEMQHPTLHAKFIVIDGSFGIVGSYNIDRYGSLHNLEMGVALHDEETAYELTKVYWNALERSEEITMERWNDRGPLERFGQWLAYAVASIR